MIYFANKGLIDLTTITTMGVSVKEGNNPIGYFGTGLKYAIATLLRTGHQITLHRGPEQLHFKTRKQLVRGQPFNVVEMTGIPLGFTDALGRNWEPWQAYRELRSNAMDEGGETLTTCNVDEWDTVFEVRGEGIEQAHRDRRNIFLESKPFFEHPACDIHRGTNKHIFYRGIKVFDVNKPTLLTYNLQSPVVLTEDRTLRTVWQANDLMEQAIVELNDEGALVQILMAGKMFYESDISFSVWRNPSEAFMRVVGRNAHRVGINPSAVRLWREKSGSDVAYPKVTLDKFERMQLDDALTLCRRLGCKLEADEFTITDGLGEGILGAVRDDKILISSRVFDQGVRMVAGTIYEEWLHHTLNYQDESRDMQNYLLDKLFANVEKLMKVEEKS